MKKIIILLLMSLLSVNTFAGKTSADARISAFYPLDEKFRDIYASAIPLYQLELSYRLCNPWSFWGNVGILAQSGESIGLENSTRIWFWPIGGGINYNFCSWKCFEPYLGTGIVYSWVRITDKSPYVEEHIRKDQLGAVVKSGVNYRFCGCGRAGIFIDYMYMKHCFSGTEKNNVIRDSLDISGLMFGASVGIEF